MIAYKHDYELAKEILIKKQDEHNALCYENSHNNEIRQQPLLIFLKAIVHFLTTPKNREELKELLIKQIENRVRWRESVINMIDKGVKQFIEIGPGKVLSGLVKRINKQVQVYSINSEEEIKNIKI